MTHIDSIPSTIKYIHDTVFSKGENAYDLVYKIDAMYQNAWNKLIIYGAIISAIVTLIVPWWLTRIRNKAESLDRKLYNAVQEEKISELKKELNKEFDSKISLELDKYNKDVERQIATLKAVHFYLLADSHLAKQDNQYAFVNFITALRYALFAKDLGNVKSILLKTTKDCIPLLSLEEILACEKVYSLKIDELLSEIGDADKDRLLFDNITNFKTAIAKQAKK